MSRMWRYFFATLTIFFIAPELRRMQDMVIGFTQLPIWAVVPLLMLLPFFYVVGMHGRYKRIPRVFVWVSWLWITTFTYGLVLAYNAGNLFAGLLTYMEFVLPLGAGLWLVTEELPFVIVYRRVIEYVFKLTTAVSVYGIIQWFAIPPWDAQWLANINITTFGGTAPFQLRAFSTLNSPGIFGIVVAAVATLGLPEVLKRDWKFKLSYASWILAIGVTTVRACWVQLLIGVIVYFTLTRKFKEMTLAVGVSSAIIVAALVLAPSNPIVSTVTDRFSTLGNLQGDTSYNERSQLYVEMVPKSTQFPMGMGLGVFGSGGKLSADAQQIDSGILSRLFELGWGGTLLFAGTFFVTLNLLIAKLFGHRSNTPFEIDTYAALIALQVAYFFLETGGDEFSGITGLIFWITLAPVCLKAPQAYRHFFERRATTVSQAS